MCAQYFKRNLKNLSGVNGDGDKTEQNFNKVWT